MTKETVSTQTEKEPFPPQANSYWAFKSEAWYSRFDYINTRVEKYLDKFKSSIDYDFTRINKKVEEAQKELTCAMEEYARGVYTVEQIIPYAKKLRNTFRRGEQYVKQKQEPQVTINESNYIPGMFYIREAAKMSGERLYYWIQLCANRVLFIGETPPVGEVYVRQDSRSGKVKGFNKEGKVISVYEAEKIINQEMLEEMYRVFGNDIYKQEPVSYSESLPLSKQDVCDPPPSAA